MSSVCSFVFPLPQFVSWTLSSPLPLAFPHFVSPQPFPHSPPSVLSLLYVPLILLPLVLHGSLVSFFFFPSFFLSFFFFFFFFFSLPHSPFFRCQIFFQFVLFGGSRLSSFYLFVGPYLVFAQANLARFRLSSPRASQFDGWCQSFVATRSLSLFRFFASFIFGPWSQGHLAQSQL